MIRVISKCLGVLDSMLEKIAKEHGDGTAGAVFIGMLVLAVIIVFPILVKIVWVWWGLWLN